MTTARTSGAGAARAVARALSPLLVLLVGVLIFWLIPPHVPVGWTDVRTVAVHTMIVGTAALGMTLIIVSGGIDLSVGSVVALAGVVAALVMAGGHGSAAGLLAAAATGVLCGAYNGVLVTALRLPPFIATLGTLGFYRGIAKWLSGSGTVPVGESVFFGWVAPLPARGWMLLAPGVWVMLGLAVLTAVLLRCTVFGRQVTAIGSNEEAARLCGVPIGRTKVLLYATAGLFAGLAGLMQFARLTVGDPTVAVGLELDVIAAVVIGGASLSGGRGSVAGTVAGAVLIAFLRNRCARLEWPNYVQEIIAGHIIIAAVAADQWRRRRSGT